MGSGIERVAESFMEKQEDGGEQGKTPTRFSYEEVETMKTKSPTSLLKANIEDHSHLQTDGKSKEEATRKAKRTPFHGMEGRGREDAF